MKVLKGEIIQNGTIMKKSALPYRDQQDFFIALVSISDQLDVDVPIWTLREEKLLEKHNEVLFDLHNGYTLKFMVLNKVV